MTHPSPRRLFLLYDDVEELLICAADKADALAVIEERIGSEDADQLLVSSLSEYTDDLSAKFSDAPRGVVDYGNPGRFKKQFK